MTTRHPKVQAAYWTPEGATCLLTGPAYHCMSIAIKCVLDKNVPNANYFSWHPGSWSCDPWLCWKKSGLFANRTNLASSGTNHALNHTCLASSRFEACFGGLGLWLVAGLFWRKTKIKWQKITGKWLLHHFLNHMGPLILAKSLVKTILKTMVLAWNDLWSHDWTELQKRWMNPFLLFIWKRLYLPSK